MSMSCQPGQVCLRRNMGKEDNTTDGPSPCCWLPVSVTRGTQQRGVPPRPACVSRPAVAVSTAMATTTWKRAHTPAVAQGFTL